MARKPRRVVRNRSAVKTTLLIVGEGPDDQAFIKHMNQTLRSEISDQRATIQKESGGSPGNIIANAARKYSHQDFDRRIFVMDSDLPIEPASRKKAEDSGYEIILWKPQCLEGVLLDLLDERVGDHETSQQLKKRLYRQYPKLEKYHTEPKAYAEIFPKPVLVSAKNDSVVALHSVLTN